MAAARATLDEGLARFERGDVGGPRGSVVAEEMAAACTLASLGLRRLAGEDVDAELPAAKERQRAAWLRSSRPGGLDDSLGRMRG